MSRFLISEDEKRRILNMHNKAYNKNVINEEQESEKSLVPGCKDTFSANGHNLGCATSRKPYYDMMRAGKLPNVTLTYKLDGPWFDNHTYTTMFDMATPASGMDDKTLAYILRVVRNGNYGVNPSKKGETLKLTGQEIKKAEDIGGINARLEAVYKGSGSPR